MQDNGAETRLPVDSTAPPKVQHGSSCLVSGHKWITSSCRRSATIEHSYLCERRSSWRNGTIALRLYRAGERAWRLGGLIHRRPCRQRVHVISPAHDLAILDRGDRHEPIVVGRIVGEYSSMHLVFECHHPPIVGRMHEQ